MTRPCPYTPLSTPLSGSARQAEARIRNLFQGPKRRPPVWLMVLALLLILSCGGLVTCQDQKVPPEKAEISALSASATSQPLSSEDLLLVDALYGAAAPQMGTAEDGESIPQLLCAHSQDGTTLAAALFQKGSASWLVIGAVEQATSTLRGPAYVVSGPEGAAHIFPFREHDSGQLRLLYPFSTLAQGSRSGSAGVGMGSFGMAAGSGSAFAAGLTGATTGSGCGGAMGEGAFSTGGIAGSTGFGVRVGYCTCEASTVRGCAQFYGLFIG